MDPIKDAFQNVKYDINSMKQELENLKINLNETREKIIELCEIIAKMHKKIEKGLSTHKPKIKTVLTHPSTHKQPLEPLKAQNIGISTGNRGVSTDRQTDRQTDKKVQYELKNSQDELKSKENAFENALEVLNSLDDIKKEIRLKFKRLTDQETLIFSTIYQIEEEVGYANYKQIAEKLNLTESSVRDYVGRLIQKGIPVDKKKINNKQIQLSISQNLKKIVTLPTILQLREL